MSELWEDPWKTS